MKTYAIIDRSLEKAEPVGYLLVFEKARECVIELRDDLGEWEVSLLFQKYVHEGVFTIPKDIAHLWVEERVIPSGRQNIGAILKQAKLSEYNEMALLAISKGKCAQDSCCLKEIKYEEIPHIIRKRASVNVLECFPADGQNIICMFQDRLVRKVSLKKLAAEFGELSHVLKNRELLKSLRVSVGGYGITFYGTLEIPAEALRDAKYAEPVLADDFKSFAQNNIVDTTKACELLGCSRQNLAYLVRKGKLEPIMRGTKENFFTLGSITRMMDD